MEYSVLDENYAERIRTSFEKQKIMETIGARLIKIEPGEVHIALAFSEAITQQHGGVHAGVLSIIADSTCGYAAGTLIGAESEIVSVEFKVNFLAPPKGEEFLAIGRVVKPGRTLTVCSAEVMAKEETDCKTVLLMQATMMTVPK